MTEVKFLQIEPTTRCNYTCGFCVGRTMHQTDLPLAISDAVFRAFPTLQAVELQGEGEPLLNRNFFRIAEGAAGAGASISMITNGSLLSDERVERILSLPIERVGVSLESPDAARFKTIRGGAFGKVLEGIARLRDARNASGRRRPVIGLNVTVLKSTLAEAEDIIALYRSLGLDGGIWFQGLQDQQTYVSAYTPLMVSEMLSADETGKVEALRKRFDEDDTIDKSGRDVGFYPRLFEDLWSGPPTCPWLVQGGYISAEGDFMPCCHVKDVRWSFGRVGKDPAPGIVARRNAMAGALRDGDIPEPCANCWVLDFLRPAHTATVAHGDASLGAIV
ncbi:MAG: hypothetical protein C0524_11860 [Rhodobacter sp.]|nr:hypothetical protein [Rhodobacter sp.]